MNRRHGRRPTFTWRGWLLVWLLPVALVAGLVGVHVALRPAPPASASAGDPYFPDAGAGGYELAHITLTEGIHLGTTPTAEALLERWGELAERDGEMVPGTGFDQARHELRKAGFAFDDAAG